MKELLAVLVAVMMLMSAAALAEPAYGGRTHEQAYTELIVGSVTAVNGNFFHGMWGNNTSDIDVRELLHGYSLVSWRTEMGIFAVDLSVVSGIVATADAAGNKTYTIALADDLRYSDGTAIGAADYVFSILLAAAPQIKEIGGMTSGIDYITGASAYAEGGAEVLSGVRLLAPNQFSVTVDGGYLPFFYELGMLSFRPYPISVIAPGCEVGDDGDGAYIRNIDAAAAPVFTSDLLRETILNETTGYMSHPSVTSGPYRLTGYDVQTQVSTFEVNPNFKGLSDGQKPQIERLTLKPVTPETMMEMLVSGEVDLLNKCTQASTIDEGMRLASEGMVDNANYMRAGLSLISFDCTKEPLTSQKVRQALALAFDRGAFVSEYVRNYGIEVNGYYGMGQWMVQLVSGMIPPPVEGLDEGATPEEEAAYEAKLAEWEALTLDELNPYEQDLEAAEALLAEEGWLPDEAGIRHKQEGDELKKLALTMVVAEGNEASEVFEATFVEPLKEVGVELTVVQLPFEQLLRQYYSQEPRMGDMYYLGTNFTEVFDPSYTYSTNEAHLGTLNTTGLMDVQLENLALDMHKTEQGDVLGYCQNWVAFQTRWNELLPAVPVYSNVYFDFFVPRLQNYAIAAHGTWAHAVVYAYLSDAAPEVLAEDGA